MAHIQNSGRGKLLIHNGYRYQRNRTRRHCIYWRCSSTQCQATLSSQVFDMNNPPQDIDINYASEHNHPPEIRRIQRQNTVNAIQEEIHNDPSVPVRRLYNGFLAENDRRGGNVEEGIPRFESIRSTLNRTRALVVPPIPANIADVDIPGEWGETWRGEAFLRIQNRDRGILIFQTNEDIRLLSRCQTIFMDGTFKTAPHPFNQLFTIHGLLNGYVFKLGCALISNKALETYQYILVSIKNEVHQLTGNHLQPERIIIDFEAGLKGAIVREFPLATINGCFFHFCQAIWKNVQRHGNMENVGIRSLIRGIMALGFVPINFVRVCYQNLQNDPETANFIQIAPALEDFFLYFERTWMRQNGIFPPALWNVHDRPMEFRTNNHVESFHNRFVYYYVLTVSSFGVSNERSLYLSFCLHFSFF